MPDKKYLFLRVKNMVITAPALTDIIQVINTNFKVKYMPFVILILTKRKSTLHLNEPKMQKRL